MAALWSSYKLLLQRNVLERQTNSVSPSFQHYKLDKVREKKSPSRENARVVCVLRDWKRVERANDTTLKLRQSFAAVTNFY